MLAPVTDELSLILIATNKTPHLVDLWRSLRSLGRQISQSHLPFISQLREIPRSEFDTFLYLLTFISLDDDIVKSAAELAQYPLRCCNYRKLTSHPTTHLRRRKKAVKHHGPGITVDRSCPLPGSDDQGDGPSRSIFLAHEHHHKGRTGDAACDGFAETQIQ